MKFIYVEWVDSMACRGWQNADFPTDTKEQMTIKSLGILHDENDDSICITTSHSHYGSPMDPLSIPKCAIVKRYEVYF
ncbi:MAG: hypothetical protein KDD61_06670 [Bdellovibrionales bacterium]|nr:hypothetical protein [Bdellovibrionales bacterium]